MGICLVGLGVGLSAGERYAGLHCIASLGITEITARLVLRGSLDMNCGNPIGHTLLAWAGTCKHS